jgi:UDP-N-acetylmuramate dehydrogenase
LGSKWDRGRKRGGLILSNDFVKEAQGLIRGRVLFDAPMRRFTSMKVGGPADSLIFPEDVDELKKVVFSARKRGIPVLILGKGTDLIVGDKGIRGWVISLTRGFKKVRCDGEAIEAEAGTTLQKLVRFSVRRGLTGLEPFFGVPGTVGGGLVMNAGAWGAEMKDVVLSVSFLNEDGKIVERSRPRLRFSYRRLDFPASWIILKARFQLGRGKKEEILDRVKSYSEMRRKTQPVDYPSAGSIFKNPKEGPAGRWIEEAGLKGFRIGQAMVSDLHANFIINLGKASAREILDLMKQVERRVLEVKGISLEREVKVVGE